MSRRPSSLRRPFAQSRPFLVARCAGLVAVCALLLGLPARPAAAACPGTATVGSFDELDAAIVAFNAATAPCFAVISLTNDIGLPAFSTTAINNPDPAVILEIDGNGFLVDGNNYTTDSVRPFQIAADTTVTMNDLIVTGGNVLGGGIANRGGGILNFGNLTLNRCTVTGNKAENHGGGIATQGGHVEIIQSTISHNVSGSVGGGIYKEGPGATLTLRNSTVSTNNATGAGGGVAFAGSGSLMLDSVTIARNTGSGVSGAGGLDLTVAFNPVVTIRNTILGENLGGKDCVAVTGSGAPTIVDQGHNLVGTHTDCGFVDGVNGDVVGKLARLDPLADNGGPTETHALKIDSPALEAGDTQLGTDQRGVARPIGASDDIGAFESGVCETGSSWTVDTFAALEAAIACFNAKTTAGVYTITLVDKVNPASSTLPIHNPTAGVSLVIEGADLGIEGDGGPGIRVLEVQADTTVTINDLSVAGGILNGVGESGSGLLNAGTVTLNRCTIQDNKSAGAGGGILNSGTMVIDQSTIEGNEYDGPSGSGGGGGIYNTGSLTLRNSTISGNTSSGQGGGIATTNPIVLDSVTVTKNTLLTPGTFGAGIAALSASGFTTGNSIIAGNTGGPDCFSGGSVTDNGHNLVQTQQSCGFVNGVNGDVVGQAPMLETLKSNGGKTRTHALLPGSPARDAGDTTLTVDQRGLPRPGGSAKDIGAYEDQQRVKLTVIKEATRISDADEKDFAFTLTGDAGFTPVMFLLDRSIFDNDSVNKAESFDLPAGTYALQEAATSGWMTDGIVCTGATSATYDVPNGTANLTMQPYEDVTCTFTNVLLAPTTCTGELIRGRGATSNCTAGFCSYATTAQPIDGARLPKLVCKEGDPGCDFGPAGDGMCTFKLSLCFNFCQAPGQVDHILLRDPPLLRPGDPLEMRNRDALATALGVLPGASVSTTPSLSVQFSPSLTTANVCTSNLLFNVPLRQTSTGPKVRTAGLHYKAFPDAVGTSPDRDSLRMRCDP